MVQPTKSVIERPETLPKVKEAILSSAEYERIRSEYRPNKVKILLVAESRPNSGQFFYCGNSKLLRTTQEVFCRLLGHDFESADEFLKFFRKAGYYLDDLCLDPVNKLPARARRLAHKASIPALANRITSCSPRMVICIMKGIEPHVREAISLSRVRLKLGFYCISFPSWQKSVEEYRAGLAKILVKR